MKISAHQQNFKKNLIRWNIEMNKREMPWKGEKDPYKIWLSEIILQQTRVEQGLAYYNRFIANFPTVEELANASETKVFKLWEGLGYYTRCKNLIATAKYISNDLQGKFPDTYDNILSLKGIGPYTAAAIGSFAFNLPYAVVDGNVFRVLARYFGIETPVDGSAGKKQFTILANQVLDKKHPGNYNQALMDFGAVICKPQLPLCSGCIMNMRCIAYRMGTVQQLPIKEKLLTKKTRWLYYLVIELNNKLYVRKRGAGDIWENLYEFVLIESKDKWQLDTIEMKITATSLMTKGNFEILGISQEYKQLLTHQTIGGLFIHLKIKSPILLNTYKMVSKKALQELPFPKFISNYLKDKNVSLNLVYSNKKNNIQ
ncbi:MAG: A/G-specific adenine glycosylase [Ferruginibacter sp.]|nr:A/G-specific adenine glycosylase [Ferruginibacter sp.]